MTYTGEASFGPGVGGGGGGGGFGGAGGGGDNDYGGGVVMVKVVDGRCQCGQRALANLMMLSQLQSRLLIIKLINLNFQVPLQIMEQESRFPPKPKTKNLHVVVVEKYKYQDS